MEGVGEISIECWHVDLDFSDLEFELDETAGWAIGASAEWRLRGIPEKFDRLPADMELVIFRIVQESLTNVHRHSGSKSASIRVAREVDRIIVEVQDQGRGIPPEKLVEIQSQGSGVGISGMRERLRHFSGELVVESNGTGTKIVATVLSKAFPLEEQVVVGQGREIT